MKNYEQMHFIKVNGLNGWLFRNIENKNLFIFRKQKIEATSAKEAIDKLRKQETK